MPFAYGMCLNFETFYVYLNACAANNWPIIAPERFLGDYFTSEKKAGLRRKLRVYASTYRMQKKDMTKEDMLSVKVYPFPQSKADMLISRYASEDDCWADLLFNENQEFEQVIGELLDKITEDAGERPEGIICYEFSPK